MADLPVLTAVSGAGWESQLVTAIERAPGGLYVARRCVDVADLLATAAAGHGRVVLLSADLRRLDREVLSRLRQEGVAVVGVVSPGSGGAVDRLRHLGVTDVVAADIEPDDLAEVLQAAVAAVDASNAAEATGPLSDAGMLDDADDLPGTGTVVAVWGPVGAPGRTTIAVNLAAELAALGRSVLLVDVDTYGPSVAQLLGLLDESAGVAAVCRAANTGKLDPSVLAAHSRRALPRLDVLTGITRAARWPEIRPSALEAVWALARRAADVTIVDTGFCLERDEALSFDTAAPRRNGAALSALETADRVVGVAAADPVGLARFVRGLGELHEAVPGADVTTVVNRVRRSVAGPRPEDQIRVALRRHADVDPEVFVPDDSAALDSAVAGGLTLAEASPGSSARQAIAALARHLIGAAAPEGRRGSSFRRWRAQRRHAMRA